MTSNATSLGELLGQHAPFAGLSPDDLRLVAGCGQYEVIPEAAYLFREGEPADRFFLVRHGRIALEISDPHRGSLVIDTIESGDVAGFSWLFPPYRWQFDGRAATELRVVTFDGACLRGKCDGDSRLGYELMKRFSAIMADRMQSARLRLLDVYGHAGAG